MYAEGLAASNNWVVSGKHTADGRPMLANDPHLAPQAPGIWYLVHLATPDMRVAGVTFPGVPGVVLGHNEHIAWGATNVGPDVQDLYREEFNDKGEYKAGESWLPVVRRKHIIKVRANPLSPETNDVEFEVEETRNGVVIPTPDGGRYALKWTARDPRNQEFEAFFMANRAKNWDEFRKAFSTYGGATQNFIYADTKGNIGWQTAGRIPLRRKGQGERIYNGATGEGDWTAMIPFEEMPRLYNPKGGIIMTANQRIVGTDYKYQELARDTAMPWRARRIMDLLKSGKKFTMDDFRDIQMDAYNYPVHFLAQDVVRRGAASKETIELLKAWNGMMKADSRAALLANEIRNVISSKIAADNRTVPADIVREKVMYWFLNPSAEARAAKWLPKEFADVDALVRAAEREAKEALAKRYGGDEAQWTWGRAWQSRFTHPLAAAPLIGAAFATPQVPIDGSGQSPNVGSAISMQLIASPGAWDSTRHVIPLGQSGDPKSPHWRDQFDSWRTGKPMVFPFSKEAVRETSTVVMVFKPR
jgi:penicillin amidase